MERAPGGRTAPSVGSARPIDGASFGVEAVGVDIARGLDAEVLKALADTEHEHRLLVVRDQHMTEDQYLAFGR